ncbi:ABC transporter substrate-binding protein [Phreatobacter stygius]|uniref:ABC transporter substrate-binding protein n=1 Tax=Phreatobacter stygius TaxID=1940610 RepID=A0A4D7BI59_9HYPH|nr:ABC transporter substrate-binding protein [Phreatobacter stygius]
MSKPEPDRPHAPAPSRRDLLRSSAAVLTGLGGSLAGLGLGGGLAAVGPADAQGLTTLKVQYDWLMSNGQIGDVVAAKKGFFAEEGLNVSFVPGGPNAQTVPPVLTGQALVGQLSGTSQALMAYGAGRSRCSPAVINIHPMPSSRCRARRSAFPPISSARPWRFSRPAGSSWT